MGLLIQVTVFDTSFAYFVTAQNQHLYTISESL